MNQSASNETLARRVVELTNERDQLKAQVDVLSAKAERLRGIKPELPPYPSENYEGKLPRYGIKWNGPTSPLAVPMDDGYWTPYHLAVTNQAEVKAQAVENARNCYNEVLEFVLSERDLDFLRCWVEGDWEAINEEWPEFNIRSEAQLRLMQESGYDINKLRQQAKAGE